MFENEDKQNLQEVENKEKNAEAFYAKINNLVDEVQKAVKEIAEAYTATCWIGSFPEDYDYERKKKALSELVEYHKHIFNIFYATFYEGKNPLKAIKKLQASAVKLKSKYDELTQRAGTIKAEKLSAELEDITMKLASIEKASRAIWNKLELELAEVRVDYKKAVNFIQANCRKHLLDTQSEIDNFAHSFFQSFNMFKGKIEEQKKHAKLSLGEKLSRSDRKLQRHYRTIDKLLAKALKKLEKLVEQSALLIGHQVFVNDLIEATHDIANVSDKLKLPFYLRMEDLTFSWSSLQAKAEHIMFRADRLKSKAYASSTLGLDKDIEALDQEWKRVKKLISPITGETKMKNLVERIRLHQDKYPISGMNLLVHYILDNVKGESLPNVGDVCPDGSVVTEKSQFKAMKNFMLRYGVGEKLSTKSFNNRSLAQQVWYDSLYKYMDDVINHPDTVKDESHYFAHAESLFAAEKALTQSENANDSSTPKTCMEKVTAVVELLCVWSEATEKLHKMIAPGLQRSLFEAVSVLSQGARPSASKGSEAARLSSAQQILAVLKGTSDEAKSINNVATPYNAIDEKLLRSTLTKVELVLDDYSRRTFFRRKDTRTLEETFKRICRAQ